MRTSTHTLDLGSALDWRRAGCAQARRKAPAVVAGIDAVPEPERATDDRPASRSRLAGIRTGFGDALDFALFAVALAAVGRLQWELLVLVA